MNSEKRHREELVALRLRSIRESNPAEADAIEDEIRRAHGRLSDKFSRT